MKIRRSSFVAFMVIANLFTQSQQSQVVAIEPLYRFWNIRIGDLVMILAVLAAPFVALWTQWRLQLRREGRERRLAIFRTLMANRLIPHRPRQRAGVERN